MTGRPTDHRNLDLEQFNLDGVFGRAGGKVIWQPRIGAWYSDRIFAGEPLPAPYTGMSMSQLYRALGCSNRVYDYNACFRSQEDPRVHIARRELNATDYEVLVETPVGNQRAVYRTGRDSPWHLPLKWPIADEAEMKVAAWREERRTWSWDATVFGRVQTLRECARRCIALFAPRLVLGISDEISARGDIERIRLVGRLVDDYNASL
jgi:hypothetical protein